jgi:hypothetical protein
MFEQNRPMAKPNDIAYLQSHNQVEFKGQCYVRDLSTSQRISEIGET